MMFLWLLIVLGAIFIPGPHRLLSTVTGVLTGGALLAFVSSDREISHLGAFMLIPALIMIVVLVIATTLDRDRAYAEGRNRYGRRW